jgi:hypothetical protein
MQLALLGALRRATEMLITKRRSVAFGSPTDKVKYSGSSVLPGRGHGAADKVQRAHETTNSVRIVEEFWERVWKAQNPAAIDDFVVDDFVITTGGVDVVSGTKFKEWASAFMAKISGLQFEVIETFQNEDGSRVASRWRIIGKNNGILGTRADQQPISFTGTAIWAERKDRKLYHNWLNAARLSSSSICAIRVQRRAENSSSRSYMRRLSVVPECLSTTESSLIGSASECVHWPSGNLCIRRSASHCGKAAFLKVVEPYAAR